MKNSERLQELEARLAAWEKATEDAIADLRGSVALEGVKARNGIHLLNERLNRLAAPAARPEGPTARDVDRKVQHVQDELKTALMRQDRHVHSLSNDVSDLRDEVEFLTKILRRIGNAIDMGNEAAGR
ncbi:hypothetical protein OU415_02515 [Saccharopolyspora sp. WRP15-2]|uniref:Uncharacterized protein n=1 Tax=Saccharopolyspora oryzae TaxID=2997343 RepID=A0ABT4URE0_9PSEU|nr:hypothetical protein [Saccharopolyspora oryzae]MDA3624291.1 hypothetical protein [Saccharopolyspora oryzae]